MIGRDVALLLIGMATGAAVRVALGARRPARASAAGTEPASDAHREREVAIALAAVAGFAKSR